MKISPLKTSFNLLLASIFAFSAQFFLLIPQLQEILLKGRSLLYYFPLAILFLLASYLNMSLVFYPYSPKKEKIVSSFSIIALASIIFLYVEAFFFVEAILFVSLVLASLLFTWVKDQSKDFLEQVLIIANIVIGLGILFIPDFLVNALYQRVNSFRVLFAFLLLITALIRILSVFIPAKPSQRILPKLISLPWIGWTLVFLWNPEVSILLPATTILFALLISGLLPFTKLRLSEKRMLGFSVFPVFFIFYTSLLFLFFYVLYDGKSSALAYKGELSFVFFLILSIMLLYGVMNLHFTLYELVVAPSVNDNDNKKKTPLQKFAERLFAPANEENPLAEWQASKIHSLSAELIEERARGKRFTFLQNLAGQLDGEHDEPVAAQLVVNTMEDYFQADIIAISLYDVETRELSILASGGGMSAGIPRGFRQSIDIGIMGRAARVRKTQLVNDTRKDQDYIKLEGKIILSEAAIPLVHHGYLKGVLVLSSINKNAFSPADIRVLESVGEELLKTWERSRYNQRLTSLIQSNIALSTSLNTQAVIEEVSVIARETLQARFVFAALFDQDGSFTRTSSVGYAPNLHSFLSRDLRKNRLLQIALDAKKPFRIRDIRKYKNAPSITLDHNMLRGLIIIPLRLHGVNIGAMLGFGKQGGMFFSEKDLSLAELMTTQATAAIENAWLIQELRSTTVTTTALYHLSFGILQIDKIEEAAQLIAETAHRLAKASIAGIVLFSLDREVQTSLEVTEDGLIFDQDIPYGFVEQALATGESITHSSGDTSAYIYLPIQTSLRKYGVLWVEFTESERQASSQAQTLQTLTNQAAIALERVMLLIDSRQKAIELKKAFGELNTTYDQTLVALMSALDARDRETEGHSSRVNEAACLLGKELNITEGQYRSLQRGSLLHDIGKIGISDTILNKPDQLTDDEWAIMRQHPSIGKMIIQEILFLEDAIPVVYSHHERWDGSGYPQGLKGEKIPIEARIFAVADIFDALTSIRPYRKKISDEEALAYLHENAGVLVDPDVVLAFDRLVKGGEIKSVPTLSN